MGEGFPVACGGKNPAFIFGLKWLRNVYSVHIKLRVKAS